MHVQLVVCNMADKKSAKEPSQSLVRNPQKVSVVWNYFGFENKQDWHRYHYRRIENSLLRLSHECTSKRWQYE